jgi:3-oxoacid CoA-transferase subunit A
MLHLTGDIHGDPRPVLAYAKTHIISPDDVIILLGDVGANFYRSIRDDHLKDALSGLPCPVLCIHGNHEMRPESIQSYEPREWHGGIVYTERAWPRLCFAKDGEVYDLEGLRAIAIGGAYSPDKEYRRSLGYGWWPDEQPSDETMAYVEAQLEAHSQAVDLVLSHTCPARFIPTEALLPGLDQSTVDRRTEEWLGHIESRIRYRAWFCGHWHIDKRSARMHFLFREWETI